MRIVFFDFTVAIVLIAAFSTGCFYDPDRSQIDLLYDSSTPPLVDGGVEGLGAPCDDSTDCAEYAEANYCAANPMSPDQGGQCTILNCTADDCPEGFQCCDCAATILAVIICIDDASAEQAVLFGCTCS